ncbi:tape measure protein [Sphingomonas sp. BAUL-RG-20F-R05-02]|uniref:tape measure protein n=1 Tax=Sphingomonas sp. BAUL-RG-20F-R05-02 TaxID=2914830 RepID=UPI001F55D1AA|nr:tape measure protein [Sphingomonas sp. BAUL-RG-20F-R05-02]
MAGTPDVKQLLLQVDASVELLRRNLNAGQARVDQFATDTQRRLDATDRRFGELGQPLGNLNTSIASARKEIATIGTSVSQAEANVRRSSEGIKSALLASASGIAAAFSVDHIKDYADGYTRFTNQLKVAGLEGSALGKTQNQLFDIAQRYGVQLETVGTLYSRASQAGNTLGATQSQLIKFTNGVGAALKVQGGSAEEAQGALLQLGQLLGSGTVHAEEFNSVNEGARPILQAVANGIDKYKGSVAALRADVVKGSVTSKDFFDGFLKGSAQLEQQASKANLTIGASFVVLNNALGKYIGETDASLSATERVSLGITTLANNLGIVLPALTTIAVGFGTVKAAGLAFGAVSTIVATVADADRALAAQVLSGNAAFVSRTQLAAKSAQLAAASAAEEVASIEATIAARQAEQVELAEQIAAERALVAERRAAAQAAAVSLTQGGLDQRNPALAAQVRANNDATFATQRLTAARERLAIVDGELAVAEGALGGAQERSALATGVAEAATARATIASRAGAAATRLLAGGLTLIGGSVAGGAAVLAIGALVGAFLLYRNAATAADERNKATAASMTATAEASRNLNTNLAVLAATGKSAASGIAQAGNSASGATGQMLSFAGAVGQAAQKLYELAKARQHEQILRFATESVDAEKRANEAQARINARRPSIFQDAIRGGGPLSAADQKANADDARIVAENRAIQQRNYQAAFESKAKPLEGRITENDKTGGFDVNGELAQVTRDLVVARKRGIKSQVDELQAQAFELTQYKKYRGKGGPNDLSPTAAKAAAAADAAKFRDAAAGAQGDRDAKAGRTAANKASRDAAKQARQQEAAAKDAAADDKAFTAAERQADNEIASAKADLTNSAVERANIEKARIEDERQNRNAEIADQAKQGRFGDGDVAKKRTAELQRLNDERAQLEAQVVDAREKQRAADESLQIASAGRSNEAELLSKQEALVTTAAQRRDLEQRILNIQYDEEKAKLEGVIASRDTSETEKKIAAQRLEALGKLRDADQANLDQKNAGPIAQYRQHLKQATDDTNEALQGVAVDGLENLESGLTGLISGTESVASAFKKMPSAIIADLARIAIEKLIVSAIGGGSFLGLKLAGGGKVEGKATGGRISGPGSGTSDSILAMVDGKKPLMVSNGESIVTAQATREHWPLIDAMNKGRLPKFAIGGIVGTPRLSSMAAPSIGNITGTSSRVQRLAVDLHAKIEAAADFNVSMQSVAARTVGAAAGPIIMGAKAETVRSLKRPSLPGGFS